MYSYMIMDIGTASKSAAKADSLLVVLGFQT